jgi:uncharacterized membrane protein
MSSWILPAIFSAIFAAFVAIFGKIGLKEIDSTLYFIIFYRRRIF